MVELIVELKAIDRKMKTLKKELTALVTTCGSPLLQVNGIAPAGAARLLADVGNIHRFTDRHKFASWNGTAPLDAFSGGLRVIAAGLASADDNSEQYISDAVDRVLRIYASELSDAIGSCRVLGEDADEHVRTGSVRLMEILHGIDPVLDPVPRDLTP